MDISSVTTRIMPTGQDADGEILYLPELFIDSPNIDSYPAPKWVHLEVAEAKEVTKGDGKKTKDQCYEAMRKAVQAEFDAGCDLPSVTLKVDFINCANTVEYAQYAKIALLAVDSANIKDAAITSAKIKDAAIDTAKIEDLAVTAAKIANATITNAQIANATIGTAQIALGAITTALIQQGAVGTAQIADASITDAKIVELSANRITTGTLSVERLIIVGSDKSIVYTINEANGTSQLSQTTIDGGSLTQRSITADRIVAGAITAKEIAAATILANNIAAGAVTADKIAAGAVEASHIKAGTITTNHVASNFGETLDLSSNTSIRSTITQGVDEALEEIGVGGVNLIQNSADHTLIADGADSYWIAADELTPAMIYTLSLKEVVLVSGSASGVTWEIVEQENGTILDTGLLEFTYGKQVKHFTLPETEGNWALYLYAGVKGTTTGVTVQFRQVKLEEGSFATTWSASPEDEAAKLSQLTGEVSALDSSIDGRVTALVDAMGLSDQFASEEEFLAAIAEIELIRSELAQHDTDLTLTFNRLVQTEKPILRNRANAVRMEFARDEGRVRVRHKNRSLEWRLLGGENAHASVRGVQKRFAEGVAVTPQDKRGDRVEKLNARVDYANARPGLSVRYSVASNRVKEDIILDNAAAAKNAALVLPLGNIYALDEHMQVHVQDGETDEELFVFSAPVTYDADGRETMATVELESMGDGVVMRYVIDPEFLATATYPVTIDPVLHSTNASGNIYDTTLGEGQTAKPYAEDHMKVGKYGGVVRCVGLLQFKDLAVLPASDTVIGAVLRMYVKSSSTANSIAAYEVLKPWTQENVYWAVFNPDSTANISADALECVAGGSAGTALDFDLTNLYRKWCTRNASGVSNNNGVAFRSPSTVTTTNYSEIYSANQHWFYYGDTDTDRKKHLLWRSRTPMHMTDYYSYDSYGNTTASRRVDYRVYTGNTADNAYPYIRTETAYDAKGNYTASTKDARGNQVTQVVDANDGTLTSVTDPNGQTVNYTYDDARRVTAVQTTGDGKTYKNSYTYEEDRIKTVSHNTTSDSSNDVTYTFGYDDLGRKTTVKVGTQVLSTNEYDPGRNTLLTGVEYGNGGKVGYTYDEFDRLIAVRHDNDTEDRLTYEYGANGQVAQVTHVVDETTTRTARTDYDLADRPCQTVLHEAVNGGEKQRLYKTQLKYDKLNNLTQFAEDIQTEIHTTGYTYDRDNRVTEIVYDGTAHKVKYTYDTLGRVATRVAECGATAGKLTSTYGYVAGGYGTNSTTPLVASIAQNGLSLSYAYDNRGNITSETRNGKTTTYAYDKLGQLVRVNDPHEGATWVFNYDRGGNITSKVRYAYTTGALGTVQETIPYAYGDSNWKDKLTAYKGHSISYDAIGNPLNDGVWSYAWEVGRRLKRMSAEGAVLTFKHDHNGLRTQKVVQQDWYPTTYNYLLHGKLITHMTVNYTDWDEVTQKDVLHFFYDAQSRPAKVSFNGVIYTYIHNLQGDIIGLLDSAGNLVVEYKYDAWGKLLATTGTLADTLGKRNPFRYRGYVYDEESGLYYLRSRYYNPEWGRFINADTLMTQYKHAGKHNLFAYCNNTPVIANDSDGKGIGALLILLGVVALTLSSCSTNKKTNSNKNTSTNRTQYNCYAHALRKKEWQHVGNASKTAVSKISNLEEVANAVLLDNADRGIRRLSSISDPIDENEYRIALRTGCALINDELLEDYHFMRQDEDGSWSHKPGQYDILYLGEGVTPDDITWDLLYTDGSVAIENFYSSETVYFAIQYE